MRCALFGPISQESAFIGNMVETAIVSQVATSMSTVYYARWQNGEVDLAFLSNHKVRSCAEVKWSNRYFDRPEELKSLLTFCKKHAATPTVVTTVDKSGVKEIDGVKINFYPASLYGYVASEALVSQDIKNTTQFGL